MLLLYVLRFVKLSEEVPVPSKSNLHSLVEIEYHIWLPEGAVGTARDATQQCCVCTRPVTCGGWQGSYRFTMNLMPQESRQL